MSLDGQTVRFTRPGLVEEYSVSMDGVRQDFVVLERPSGAGELAVRLAVSGGQRPADGARLRPGRILGPVPAARPGRVPQGAALRLNR